MPYVVRDANGRISAVYMEAADEASDLVPPADPELRAFLSSGDAADVVKKRLIDSDVDLVRVTEDLIQTLVDKGVIMFTDLPREAQKKLTARQVLRDRLGALAGLIDEDVGI